MHTQKHTIIIDGVEFIISTEAYNAIKQEVIIDTDEKFGNRDYYKMRVGKTYGKHIEETIINHFNDIEKSNTQEYDSDCDDLRVEIKSTRAVSKSYKKSDKICPAAYAIDVDDGKQMFLSTFQQIKPSCCDWFIFHILYKNSNRYFVVPSRCIQDTVGKMYKTDEKIYLSPQHRGNKKEGAIRAEKFIELSSLFEVPENITSLKECIRIVEGRLASQNSLVA